MALVVSLGGSVLARDDYAYVKEYAQAIDFLSRRYKKVYVVVGGGSLARKFISLSKELGASSYDQDMIGIYATRLNALLFSHALGLEEYEVPTNEQELLALNRNIAVIGGVKPGQSTDMVATNIALMTGAKEILNVTNVEGVYDKNPKEYKDAVLIKELCYNDFLNILAEEKQSPGNYALFDIKAIELLKDSSITLRIFSGSNVNNIKYYEDKGTVIRKC